MPQRPHARLRLRVEWMLWRNRWPNNSRSLRASRPSDRSVVQQQEVQNNQVDAKLTDIFQKFFGVPIRRNAHRTIQQENHWRTAAGVPSWLLRTQGFAQELPEGSSRGTHWSCCLRGSTIGPGKVGSDQPHPTPWQVRFGHWLVLRRSVFSWDEPYRLCNACTPFIAVNGSHLSMKSSCRLPPIDHMFKANQTCWSINHATRVIRTVRHHIVFGVATTFVRCNLLSVCFYCPYYQHLFWPIIDP